jgi:hypothetical protein
LISWRLVSSRSCWLFFGGSMGRHQWGSGNNGLIGWSCHCSRSLGHWLVWWKDRAWTVRWRKGGILDSVEHNKRIISIDLQYSRMAKQHNQSHNGHWQRTRLH